MGERPCLLGRATCGDRNPCAAHHRWAKVAGRVDEFFNTTTIATLLRDNPRARAEARDVISSIRHSNHRTSHGSVA